MYLRVFRDFSPRCITLLRFIRPKHSTHRQSECNASFLQLSQDYVSPSQNPPPPISAPPCPVAHRASGVIGKIASSVATQPAS